MSDEDLMALVKSGKLDAMTGLFDRYHKRLYNFYLRLTNNPSLSEDWVQMVFERIIKYRKSYKPDASFKSWIYQIARNVRADHYRLNKIVVDDYTELVNLDLPTDNHQQRMEQREATLALEHAIQKLKSEYREVLWLGHFEEMPYAEVGKVLGITVANVKVRMHRAIKELRKEMMSTDLK